MYFKGNICHLYQELKKTSLGDVSIFLLICSKESFEGYLLRKVFLELSSFSHDKGDRLEVLSKGIEEGFALEQDLFSRGRTFYSWVAAGINESLGPYLGLFDVNTKLIISTPKISRKLLEEIRKQNNIVCYEVSPIRFWEVEQLRSLAKSYYKIEVENAVWDRIYKEYGDNAARILQLMEGLQTAFGDKCVTVNDYKSFETEVLADKFQLSSLLSQKKIKLFLHEILKLAKAAPGALLPTFIFLEGHLVKMLSASSIRGKQKLTSYDKSILEWVTRWSREELLFYLKVMAKWQMMAKKKDPLLENSISAIYIRICSRLGQ